jgi:uncharacterized protein with HEPN domain
MASLPDSELVAEILRQILASVETVEKRMRPIRKPDDFLKNDRNLEKLDSVCMQLIAIGESIKNLDKVTDKQLLKRYPDFEWTSAMGMRDILSHHYFDLNSEIDFQVAKGEIPKLRSIVGRMIEEVDQ